MSLEVALAAGCGAGTVLGANFILSTLGCVRWVPAGERRSLRQERRARRKFRWPWNGARSSRLSDYFYDAIEGPSPPPMQRRSLGQVGMLCGSTMLHRASEDREKLGIPPPEPGGFHDMSWSVGDATNLKVRVGPDYLKNSQKAHSQPALYECIGVDIVRGARRLDELVPRLAQPPVGGTGWRAEYGMPRTVLINCQLPFQPGPKLMGEHPAEDGGVSIMGHFVVSPALIKASEALYKSSDDSQLPNSEHDEGGLPLIAAKLLHRFANTQEEGTLAAAGNKSSGALKAIAWVENVEDLEMPAMLRKAVRKWNGKPVLLGESAKLYLHPEKQWMEIDFDVRCFMYPARSFLSQFHSYLRRVSVHVAFVIQGTKDEELPENVLCSVRLHALDIHGGEWLDDPRTNQEMSDMEFSDG